METERDNPNLNFLAQSIAADPGMVAIALRLANSPLFRTGTPITDVRRPLDRLGLRNIVCVVIAAALRASMTGVPTAFAEKFWAGTSFLAQVAAQVARRQPGIALDAVFTYALFHNAGIPLMARRVPGYIDVMDDCRATGRLLKDAEDELFPCNHAVLGSLMVRGWGLPLLVSQAIGCHHEPDLYELPGEALPGGAVSLIAVTQIAERLLADHEGRSDIEVGDALFARNRTFRNRRTGNGRLARYCSKRAFRKLSKGCRQHALCGDRTEIRRRHISQATTLPPPCLHCFRSSNRRDGAINAKQGQESSPLCSIDIRPKTQNTRTHFPCPTEDA